MTAKKTAKPKAAPKHPLMVNDQAWDKVRVLEIVCDRLATSSLGIGNILTKGWEGHTLPTYSSLMAWIDADSKLLEMYTRAKEAQADFMVDELMEISDSEVEMVVDQNGVARRDSVDVNHKRLRVDTRKWVAAKLKPKKYGDKLDVTSTVKYEDLSDEELDRRLAEKMRSK